MTLYSVLPTGQDKVAVLATWPGEDSESHSAKVTSFTNLGQAARTANDLTRVSEAMWDAAAWLDVYDIAEAALADLVAAVRESGDLPLASKSMFDGCRHAGSWTGINIIGLLSSELPATLNTLNQAQRLSVSEELAVDARARTASLALLPSGFDPEKPASRIWQAADITRAAKFGLTGPLPDCAAAWVARVYDTQRGPAQRWGAREAIHRIEQLEAAAQTVNGRGGASLDDMSGPVAHLVLPLELFGVQMDQSTGGVKIEDQVNPLVAGSALARAFRDFAAANPARVAGDVVFYVAPDIEVRKVAPWDLDVFAKLVITTSWWGQGAAELGALDATDTAGFIAALGGWVSHASFRK